MINSKMYFHECEIKYRLYDEEEKNIQLLLQNGFELKEDILETDYSPDVEGFLCKKNHLMFRIRLITGSRDDCLVTLKINQKNEHFQDNYEIEYYDSGFDKDKFNEINRVLERNVGITIPEAISSERNINDIILMLKNVGFVKNRMLSQKKRRVFSNGDIKVSFDTFPRNIGKYMEIEASSAESLHEFVTKMKFDSAKIEPLNYGSLIQKKQSQLNELEKRICIF